MKITRQDPSAIVIPFGKHKGMTVAELLVNDPDYAQWIAGNGWVAERFAELHAAILARGAASDDSPEHNAIQARFLDQTFQVACLLSAIPGRLKAEMKVARDDEIRLIQWHIEDAEHCLKSSWRTDNERAKARIFLETAPSKMAKAKNDVTPLMTRVMFEMRGIDVAIYWRCSPVITRENSILIEIKPSMGDDFPTVMRQMERLKANVLVLGEYTGRAVPAPQLRQMFAVSGYMLLFVRDIEAEIPNARAMIESGRALPNPVDTRC